jgi:hypothetical protein
MQNNSRKMQKNSQKIQKCVKANKKGKVTKMDIK